jgi:hypothetical protein
MSRKLLPYEYDLIECLGVSKEDYLEFIALQEIHTDSKDGTIFDVQNDFGITAIVLAIVGLIFQVVSTVLAPRPKMPDIQTSGGGQQQTRDERFSPRFGFNSTQELAHIGDPIHLVYANRGTGLDANPNGGVRLTSALLWSAVRSYGSSQYIQMLLLLAGGAITAIDSSKSAFGDTPVRDLISQNIWMYFNPGGTGALTRGDELQNTQDSDPSSYGANTSNPYRLQVETANNRVDGFSQAYSPTTANSCGVYNIVPLNINLYVRNASGDKAGINLGISASMLPWVSNTALVDITLGTLLVVTLNRTGVDSSDIGKEAEEARRSLASNFDSAGIFKLGTAIFRVTNVNNSAIDEANMTVAMTCITAGRCPSAAYTSYDPASTTGALTPSQQTEYDNLSNLVTSLLTADQRDINTAADLANAGDIQTARYVESSYGISFEEYIAAAEAGDGNIWSEGDGEGNAYYRRQTIFEGYVRERYLTTNEINSLRRFTQLQTISGAAGTGNDIFYTKALARIETARYETMSACHIVDMALKASVYKRISGRQTEYGSERRGGYPVNDNGLKSRVSMFKLRYKEIGQTNYVTAPGVFAVRRAADNDNFVYIKFNSGLTTATSATHWAFELEPISDPIAETDVNTQYFYLENTGLAQTTILANYTLTSGQNTTPSIQFTGTSQASNFGYPPVNNNPPDLNEWDLFNYDSDTQLQFSFDNGPEVTVTAVSEQLIQPFTDYTVRDTAGNILRQLYQNIALFGFNAYSSKTIQDLRSFSVFVTQGRSVRKLRTSGNDESGRPWGAENYAYYPTAPNGASSFAPDIFLDTILDKEDGIGDYAVVNGIDVKQLAITKRFCAANNLYMDCIIADPRSWREFWVEAAPFNLLEFARIGGRETLVPAVPYNSTTGAISRTVNVSAIFNQGNILEDSYKEEYIDFGSNVQDLIASVVYSDVPTDAIFSKKKSIDVQLADTVELDAIRQTFDLSAYVSNESQAILFGKLMCNTRRHVRQAIEFKTYPTSDPLSPGAYIYVDIGQNSWDSIRTGLIGVGGILNVPLGNTPSDGTYNFRLYRSDAGMVTLNNVTVVGGISSALANYENYLFVLGVETTTRRVFRVSEVTMDEEGEITVRATIYPCTTDSQSLIADFNDNLFTVQR